KAIVHRFASLNPAEFPAVLVTGHGPFCWGRTAHDAAHTAVVLERIAEMAYLSMTLNQDLGPIDATLLDKHFLRKHGAKAYYGQRYGGLAMACTASVRQIGNVTIVDLSGRITLGDAACRL